MAIRQTVGRLLGAALARALSGGRREAARRYRLTLRLNSLLEGLRDRLTPDDYAWAVENSGQTEWELAIVTIREAIRDGTLSLEPDEERELAAIEAQVDRRLLRQLLVDHS